MARRFRLIRRALCTVAVAGLIAALNPLLPSAAVAATPAVGPYTVTNLGPLDESFEQGHEGNFSTPVTVTSSGAVLLIFAGLLKNGVELHPSENIPANYDKGAMQLEDVNDSNLVVGTVDEAPGTGDTSGQHAAFWQATTGNTSYHEIDLSGFISKEMPAGGTLYSTTADRVDAAGEITGAIEYEASDGSDHEAGFLMASSTASPEPVTTPVEGGPGVISDLNATWETVFNQDTGNLYRLNRSTKAAVKVRGDVFGLGNTSLAGDGTVSVYSSDAKDYPATEVKPNGSIITLSELPTAPYGTPESISDSDIAVGIDSVGYPPQALAWDPTGAVVDMSALTGIRLTGLWSGHSGQIAGVTLAGELYLLTPGTAPPPPPVVNSTADAPALAGGTQGCTTGNTVTVNGVPKPQCTLRAAIQAVNAAGTGDITFALPTDVGNASTIQPMTPLPALTASGSTLNGTTGPGGSILINGFDLDPKAVGLQISGTKDVVQGFRASNLGTFLLIDAAKGADVVRDDVIGVTDGGGTTGVLTGVDIESSPNNTVGGTAASDRDILSALNIAVLVHGKAATGNRIQGDYFGTDTTGTTAIPDYEGVAIVDASNTLVGGPTTTAGEGAGNVMIGTSAGGTIFQPVSGYAAVTIGGFATNATGNVVEGNTVGLLPDGTPATSDTFYDGIDVLGRAASTVIGGNSPGDGNVLTDASHAVLSINGSYVIGTQVLSNLIGTDRNGLTPAPHSATYGVLVSGARNTTIGTAGTGRNVVTAQTTGVAVVTTPTPSNSPYFGGTVWPGTQARTTGVLSTVISGNIIGPLADGKSLPADHLQTSGVILQGDGDTLGPNNQVSGNGYGVYVAAPGETVRGNSIGVDSTGLDALPNGTGVLVGSKVPDTFTLGVAGAKPNTISGNLNNVVLGSRTTMQNNYVGTTTLGNAPVVPYGGTLPSTITNGETLTGSTGLTTLADGTVIGGTRPGTGNVISGNTGYGLASSGKTVIEGNKIGVGADGTTAVPNTGDGVVLAVPAQVGGDPLAGAPTVGPWAAAPAGGNVIANNGGDGIHLLAKATPSVLLSNAVYDNTGGGIVHAGAAPAGLEPDAPTQDGQGDTMILIPVSDATPGTVVQIYASSSCSATAAQGRVLLQTETINSSGLILADLPLQPVGTQVSTTVTRNTGASASDNTSDFSPCVAVTAQSALITPSTVPQGGAATGTGSGFAPGEQVDATLHSTPLAIGTVTADPTGAVTVHFTVPADFAIGRHELVLVGRSSGHVAIVGFTVAAASSTGTTGGGDTLAETGEPQNPQLLGLGVLALVLGGALCLLGYRRRSCSAQR